MLAFPFCTIKKYAMFCSCCHFFSNWKRNVYNKVNDCLVGLITLTYGIMLPSKWENFSCSSTKLIHGCKKLSIVLDCG